MDGHTIVAWQLADGRKVSFLHPDARKERLEASAELLAKADKACTEVLGKEPNDETR